MSLRLRFAAVVAGLVVVAVALVGVLAVRSARQELRHRIDVDLLERVAPLTGTQPAPSGFPGTFPAPRGGPRRIGPRDDVFRALVAFDAVAQFVGPDGRVAVVLDDTELPVDSAVLEAARSGPQLADVDVGGEHYRMVTVALREGYLQIARPLGEVDAAVAGLRSRVLVIGALMAALAALVGWVSASRLVGPLRRLTGAAERIAATGDVSERVEVTGGGDEVARLSASFAAMLAALEESRRRQHRLVMDASHELRTPLTSLRTNLEVLRRLDELDPDDRRALLADLEAEAVELGELVAELVEAATDVRADEPLSLVTLDEIAEAVVERVRRRSGRSVELEVVTTAPVEVRREALARAVRNLVDNAVKFSPPDTPVRVVVDGRRLEVHDAGPGVPEGEREAVFDRFHRLESTRTLPGSGLGLSIVKAVAEAHGARVWLDASPLGGTRAVLDLTPVPAPVAGPRGA
ncbi:MAG: sensor histidine kinase [Actinomyces sp.]|nr:MAG: sensor histidine kinase [Actinomyces sp.]